MGFRQGQLGHDGAPVPQAGLRRLAEGVIGLATPELERTFTRSSPSGKTEFGGKTLEQYLEQLRIAVTLRAREGATLSAYLGGE